MTVAKAVWDIRHWKGGLCVVVPGLALGYNFKSYLVVK